MILSALLALSTSVVIAQEKVQVKTVTPQGFVKSVDQVRIEFAKPMVKFGDINLNFPAKSECLKEGQGRWVDTRNWVYDFKTTLPGGKACSVTVGDKTYSFNTGGPHIMAVLPRDYRPIDPDQNLILFLDSPANAESVSKGAYFVVAGLGDRIPVVLVTGSEAEKVKNAAETDYKWEKDDFKNPNWIVVKSTRTFPPAADVTLVWGTEVKSVTGSSSPEPENLSFKVVEPFKATFSCEREAAAKPCIPILGFRLGFSSPVSVADAKKIYFEGPDKKKIYASGLDNPKETTTWLEFRGPYPQNTEYTLFLPSGLKDDDGRELSNKSQFPLKVKTGDDPALLKFASNFGLVESGPEASIAVTLRRVEKTIASRFMGWTGKFEASKFSQILNVLNEISLDPYDSKRLKSMATLPTKKIEVQKPLKASEVEVVGIPLKENGFFAIEMESPLLGQALLDKKSPYYVRAAALVTNLTAHVKFSDDQAWVWVTRLNDAKVVEGAKVSIYDVKGQIVTQATTDAKGFAKIKFGKPKDKFATIPHGVYTSGFFVVAEKGDDFTFTHSSWDNGIENWRFQLGYGGTSGVIGHAILDRTLFRPEEKLSAKIIVRKTTETSLGLPADNEWPTKISFQHESGVQSFDLPLKWDKKKGSAVVSWPLPPAAKMGAWRVVLKSKKNVDDISVGNFSVEAFRIPLLQVQIQGSPNYMQEKNIDLQSQVRFFSGGPAPNLPMKVRWSVEPEYFNPQNSELEEYSFINGGVKEGLFRSGEDEGVRSIPQSGTMDIKTNEQGVADIKVRELKYAAGPQRLRAELEYKDPNGEIKNAARSFGMWPSDVVLGIKTRSWWATPELIEFDVVALDLKQRPLGGQKVQVDLYTANNYSHRKRLVGGFYAYEDFIENKKIGELCKGVTDSNGMFTCSGKAGVTGSVLAVVRSQDKKGRDSFARVNQWVVKKGSNQWFGSDDHDRADLIPFKKSYEPGEVAEIQLRTPFPTAKVLVTVERDSVMYSEVIDVSGDKPVIKLPIKKEYAPNVVVSAFAVRGRLNDPKPTALIDLGRPAMKLGMTNLRVGIKENTLKVTVQTDRKTYKARDKSEVTIKVKDFKGLPANKGEVVVVAVDEGLLELRSNQSWDLMREMMQTRSHDVQFATAQTLVIGKRHFGLKALPIGGDGAGGGLRRELFDSLLYWNPAVKLNEKGEAKVQVPLNDSTTSFRIVAVATQNLDEFGTGWTSIESTQDLMIMPGLSGVARQGDDFGAGFSVRNASKEKQDVEITIKTQPVIAGLSAQKISLAPGETKELHWKIKVPDTEKLDYIVTAKGVNGKFFDEIKKSQKVLPVRVARVYQSEWGSWPEFSKIPLQAPAGAIQKSLIFEASEGLGGSTTGLKEFWDNYKYNCLEQQVSRAISTNDQKLWKQIANKLATYMDSNGLLKYFPGSSEGSVILTSYVLSIANEAGFVIDDAIQDRMLLALSEFAEGRLKSNEFAYADGSLRKISVFETLSRYRRLNLDLLTSVEYLPSQWPLYSLAEWYQILLWEKEAPKRAEELTKLENILRNKFYFSAKRLQLRDEGLDTMPWMMRDPESALIRLMLTTMTLPQWQSDVPRMYTGLLSRQKEGSWETTTNNAWGRILIDKVKAKYSKDKVEGTLTFKLGSQSATHNWAKKDVNTYELPWKAEDQATWSQQGSGKPWITVSMKAVVPVTKPIFAGFNVEKTITPVSQKKKGTWSVGDVAKIQLKVKTPAPQSWVVVEDPIPAGASILEHSWATSTERKEELIRNYYSWFNGQETMEYTIRFNQPGTFLLPTSRIEAMYSPDLFAELPESQWVVQE